MRTKTYINGFKNSQKIRVIIDGFGIYTTIAGVASVFATTSHQEAANEGLMKLASMRYNAKKIGDPIPVGIGMTGYSGKQVQVDLI